MQHSLSSYLTGLTNMASSMSKNIGPSFIEVDCMNKKSFKEEFAKYYEISLDLVDLEEDNKSLEQVFGIWLGRNDKNLVDSLLYWIRLELGKDVKVYKIKNDKLLDALSRCSGGISMFYNVEDIYFVSFDKYMVCFSMGNNE